MVDHPFVQEVAAGTLPKAKFDFWVQQDYLYVLEFRKLLGLAVAAAPNDSEDVRDTLIGALAGLGPEIALFRDYAAQNNLSLAVPMAPTCQSYAAYLLSVAALGGFAEAMATLYAAEKAYYDTWSAVRGTTPAGSAYASWVANWTSEAFGSYVEWLGATLDRLVEGQPATELARLRQIFLTTVRYEYMFWEMCYRQEQWPI
jgi:thiaminase/transcriptional activator TenA